MNMKKNERRMNSESPSPSSIVVGGTSFVQNQRQNCRRAWHDEQNGLRPGNGWGSVRFGLVCLSLVLLLLVSVTAFGVKPAQKTLEFKPNLVYDGQFNIVRDSDATTQAKLVAEGDLAQYVTFPTDLVELTGTETSVRYALSLPDTLSPGTHVAGIVITEESGGNHNLNARIGLTFKVYVTVPGGIAVQAAVPAAPVPAVASEHALSLQSRVAVSAVTAPKVNLPVLGIASLALFNIALIIMVVLARRRKP
jgi:hypothetical protein